MNGRALSDPQILTPRWTIANARYAASAVDVDPVTGDPLHPNNAAGRAVIAAIYLYYGFYNIGAQLYLHYSTSTLTNICFYHSHVTPPRLLHR